MKALIVSTGLDTNGQNARFVKAAEAHGTSAAVLRVLAVGRDDPAGVVARFAKAAEKAAGLEIREAHKAETYFEFPRDIRWDRHNWREIARLADEADVIHLNNSYRAYFQLGCHKPALLHHHGSLFRKDPAHMLGMAREYRMLQAVSTIDLQKPAPEILHWLPTAYDLPALMVIRKAHRREDDGRVRVLHAPTNREAKGTREFLAACRTLQDEGLPLDLVLVEGRTNAECLVEKAKADVLFEQTTFGYGCNAVEAWGMGLPVIAGAEDPWVLEQMRRTFGGRLPFVEASRDTIADALRQLVLSADMRAEWGARGLAHARRFHAEKPALARLAELYAMAVRHYDRHTEVLPPCDAVTFESARAVKVWVEGQPVQWVGGRITTTDPLVIVRLRHFASTRPLYGIREVEA